MRGKSDSSHVESGESALISKSVGENEALLEWLEPWGSTQVATFILRNLSSCLEGAQPPLDF